MANGHLRDNNIQFTVCQKCIEILNVYYYVDTQYNIEYQRKEKNMGYIVNYN